MKRKKKKPSFFERHRFNLLVVVIVLSVFSTLYILNRPKTEAPPFKKEGTLQFLKAGRLEKLVEIDVEIANTPAERSRGLMYRKSLGGKQGMVFLFERMGPQSFWMKNTSISLDIIFADDKAKIVHIAKETTPFSEAHIPSKKDAIYIIEVNAGFCDRYGISTGDYFRLVPDDPS